MITDELGVQLHDKATRGLVLTEAEQQQLEQWYAEKDQEEGLVLANSTSSNVNPNLQAKIDATLIQIVVMAKRLQEIVLENQQLRQEITSLRQ
ncbi:hypothetical protein [Thiolinea disciformis]|uniref:hypothetical protein n=1 Tax=Thiolinea disciformis TaxID=125614 RepID=UPI000378374B|nr:hypothetical protein [Thiolinea disciformis]